MSGPTIDDEDAQDALRNGSKSRPVPTHSAMRRTEENPDANATDAEDDDGEWDEDRQ